MTNKTLDSNPSPEKILESSLQSLETILMIPTMFQTGHNSKEDQT